LKAPPHGLRTKQQGYSVGFRIEGKARERERESKRERERVGERAPPNGLALGPVQGRFAQHLPFVSRERASECCSPSNLAHIEKQPGLVRVCAYDKQAYRGALLVRGCAALYFYRDGFVFQAHRLLYHST